MEHSIEQKLPHKRTQNSGLKVTQTSIFVEKSYKFRQNRSKLRMEKYWSLNRIDPVPRVSFAVPYLPPHNILKISPYHGLWHKKDKVPPPLNFLGFGTF